MNRSTQAPKAAERSVQSLQHVFAFVVALAVGKAVETTFVEGGQLIFLPQRLPVFLAFIVTVVPFFHGMNRHMDRCYIERRDPHVQGALLMDFSLFFVESCLLFAFAMSSESGLLGFGLLVAILVIDIPWAMISHWIHYRKIESSTKRWALVNAIAIVLFVLVLLLDTGYSPEAKLWALAVLATCRSVADYLTNWEFYFPPASGAK